jgi:hypothetical protein
MIIDCDSCTMRDLACSDCVVSVLISVTEKPDLRPREEITHHELKALETLSEQGLVPPLRFRA